MSHYQFFGLFVSFRFHPIITQASLQLQQGKEKCAPNEGTTRQCRRPVPKPVHGNDIFENLVLFPVWPVLGDRRGLSFAVRLWKWHRCQGAPSFR